MKTTKPASYNEAYTTHSSEAPDIPGRVAPYIEARRQVAELDKQLSIIRAVDKTREGFSEFY